MPKQRSISKQPHSQSSQTYGGIEAGLSQPANDSDTNGEWSLPSQR